LHSRRYLNRTIITATLALAGCGANDPPAAPAKADPVEIDGTWVYLGPSDAPHLLTISDSSMAYAAVAGDWSSNWTIKAHDNGLDHFQVAFGSGTGTYLPVGQTMSGTYDLNGSVLTVQLAQGISSYPQLQDAGTCTSAVDGVPVPECRLYIKQN
jgi:hypothetical protein